MYCHYNEIFLTTVMVCFILCSPVDYSAGFMEGENCTLIEDKSMRKCCDYTKSLLEQNNTMQKCGFDDDSNKTLVCCPSKLDQIGKRSREECEKYLSYNIDLDHLIFFGISAMPKEFPHMAAIGKSKILWVCGGCLISNRYVLTAAHCVHNHDLGAATLVRLGDLDLKNNTEYASPVDFKIERAIRHPDYKPPSLYHDIALLKLNQTVELGLFIKPACLHTQKELPGSVFTATGWGKTGLDTEPSSHLLKVNVTHIQHKECVETFSKFASRKLPREILDEYQICAGDAAGQDTCQGDSGGPLQVKRTNSAGFIVVGVTSFGKICGLENSVGVYTRVSSYIAWIESIVWP